MAHFTQTNTDLTISFDGTSDKVTISEFFNNSFGAVQVIKFLADGSSWTQADAQRLLAATTRNGSGTITGTAAPEKLYGSVSIDVISGMDGGDFIFGHLGNDSLFGGNGKDDLHGGEGADTLDGGTDTDILVGGAGDDYYYVDNAGDIVTEQYDPNDFNSYDTIETTVSYGAPANVEALVAGGPNGISLTANDDGCELYGNDGDDYLKGGAGLDQLIGGLGIDTLEGGAGDDYYMLYDTKDNIFEQTGGGNDQIWAYVNNVTMGNNVESLYLKTGAITTATGGSTNNRMYGNSANNFFKGMAGDDRLFGNGGNDTLTGGFGNDYLEGGVGSDTYEFALGDGADQINDFDGSASGADKLSFLGSIKSDQLWFVKSGSDLQVSVIGTSDKITVSNWYLGSSYMVEAFSAAGSAKTLSNTKVDALVNAMAAFTPPAPGQTTLPTTYQSQLSGVITSSWS